MTPTLEQTVKKRLQSIAKERNVTPAEVWTNVISERFLARLCKSPYQSHFILKGGTLLAKHVKIGRETKDLDFTIKGLKDGATVLEQILSDIVGIDLQDGFTFTKPRVAIIDQFQMEYPGIQVNLGVHFGNSTYPLFIDLGFGDAVVEEEQKIRLLSNAHGPLFEADITLNCYPTAFIFAEKLETVIYRGSNNSRMKDYHDLYTLICSEKLLNGQEAERATRMVFAHRQTPLQLPLTFDASELERLQFYWDRYRPSTGVADSLPHKIRDLIEAINSWLKTHTNLSMG